MEEALVKIENDIMIPFFVLVIQMLY